MQVLYPSYRRSEIRMVVSVWSRLLGRLWYQANEQLGMCMSFTNAPIQSQSAFLKLTIQPNGGDKCHYRHALPPGFVLRSEKKAKEDAAKKEKISLEDFLEVEVSHVLHRPTFYHDVFHRRHLYTTNTPTNCHSDTSSNLLSHPSLPKHLPFGKRLD